MDSTIFTLLSASPLFTAPADLARRILSVLGEILVLTGAFRSGPITPAKTYEFEIQLQKLLMELGRQIVEWTFNNLEPAEQSRMPKELTFGGEVYRRESKSPRRHAIGTLFGPIRLVRFLYRPWTPREPFLFPLEINLGIEAGGATPALALKVASMAADLTQSQTLERLKQEHGVSWSVETLRKLTASISERMGEHQHPAQQARLLELLDQADKSSGPRKIVLSVGRDGIFVPIRKSRSYQEAATATVAVHDRSGRRLGTVYLGRMPQSGQGTLSKQLICLLSDVLAQWHGPMPRLCYVTDAGHHPTVFFKETLRKMLHPRTGKLLEWEWVVDYFHVCGYISKLAQALFGEGKEASAWARKMRRWLKTKPNGAYRVLHSAAALKDLHGLSGAAKQFADAYRYIKDRLGYLDYVDYRRRGLPIGSGVTEAACKIVVTWRLKQSGMKWNVAGGQIILDLRVLRLSNVWKTACDAYLAARPSIELYTPTESKNATTSINIAA